MDEEAADASRHLADFIEHEKDRAADIVAALGGIPVLVEVNFEEQTSIDIRVDT